MNTFTLESNSKKYQIDKFVTTEERVKYTIPRDASNTNISVDRKDMWRYFHLLPVRNINNVISLGEGATPLKRVRKMNS